MKTKSFKVIVLVIILPWPGLTQVYDEIRIEDTCSYFGESLPDTVTTFSSDHEAEEVIRKIVDASGLIQNFEIRAAGVPNAAAVISGNVRYILYSQYFMQNMKRDTNSSWAPISIMAHEVGHHLNGHTLDSRGSRPIVELEADYYSGFILQRMGSSLDDARVVMLTFGSDSGSSTHPPKHDRLAAIVNGWTKACNSDSSCDINATPTEENTGTEPEILISDSGVPRGLPSGFGMQVCGCWGYNPPLVAPEPRCQSGSVRLNVCPGICSGGGSPYAYVCQ